jgi:hypothetical protein
MFTALGPYLLLDPLYQERAAFGKMKMDPGKRAQTQILVKFHRSNGPFPIR